MSRSLRHILAGRRAVLAGAAALAAAACAPKATTRAITPTEGKMRDIVLIHGAWHGAWCWDLVRPMLEEQGHRVHAFTLPGLAERADELTPQLGLQDHINDAIRQIDAAGIESFILVGQSYGGMVITGVADALKSRIDHIVYLDAALPKDGETMLSYGAPRPAEAIAGAKAAMRGLAQDGMSLPAFPPSFLGIPEDHPRYDWVAENLTPHPLKTWLDPISLPHGGAEDLPSTYVECTNPRLAQTQFAWVAEQKRAAPGWNVVALDTGHDAMITDPQGVARIIAQAAGTKESR
ncbi:MAG: alpha/beta hydrolase [Pseudomonadota bacterium]